MRSRERESRRGREREIPSKWCELNVSSTGMIIKDKNTSSLSLSLDDGLLESVTDRRSYRFGFYGLICCVEMRLRFVVIDIHFAQIHYIFSSEGPIF